MLVNTALWGNYVSSSCSPRISLCHTDVCYRLEPQPVLALLYRLCMRGSEKGLGTKLRPGTKSAQNKLLQTPNNVLHWNEEFTAENDYYRKKLKIEEALTAEGGKDSGNERSLRPIQNNESWHCPVTAHSLLATQWPENKQIHSPFFSVSVVSDLTTTSCSPLKETY